MCSVSSFEITSVQISTLDLVPCLSQWRMMQGNLTQWRMTLMACFAPDRVNEAEAYVSTVPCSVALFWSSAA